MSMKQQYEQVIVATATKLLEEKRNLVDLERQTRAKREWVETIEKDLAFYIAKLAEETT